MRKTLVYEEQVTIPTYAAGVPEKNPLFIEKRAYQGSTGKVYPLPVTEKVSEEKTDVTYRAVILENDYLYVMILPELGGRIQRAYDKTNGYDFVYYNRVIKPALVGLAGPWISGGIEFNWPQHHRPSTFMPVDCTFRENADGSATVIVGETDRMYGTKGNAFITLYPDKAYIEIRGRLYNPTDFPQTFLWWANPAVAVNDQTFSVFPPDVNAVMDHGKRAVSTFPIATGEYYKADYSKGVDISRYRNIRVPTSYMAAHSDFDFVGNYDEGRNAGLLHVADHHISPGKKQWTWGCGDFGKTWDKNLTDEDGPYIELMTGVFCDNQPDFTWLKPQEEKNFVQYFMPYKEVGRVSNATRDAVIGVDFLDASGKVLEPSPFDFGKAANEKLESRASCGRLKIYATGVYPQALITVKASGKTIYEKRADLSPVQAFVDTVEGLRDFTVAVTSREGKLLCAYREYVKENRPVPEPAEVLKNPSEIESLEELYLAGQHLEQYRHATYLPSDYYLEGLRRDPSDIRLNNAYGLLLLRNGSIKESLPYFRAAIKKQTWRNPNPYHGEAYLNLGLALELLERDEEAYDAFYKAVWSAETAGQAFFHLAAISVKRGDLAAALQFADESLIRQYHNMKARGLKAAILAKLCGQADADGRETAEAGDLKARYRAFLAESAAIDPLYFAIQYRLADRQAFLACMGGKPENYLNLSLEFMEYGFFEDAVRVLELCEAESPLKQYYRAYALSRIRPQTPELRELALEAASAGEAALPDYCFPNRLAEKLILERAILLLGDTPECGGEEGTEETGAAVRLPGKAPMAHYYLGELLYDKKLYGEAAAHWECSVSEKPELALAHRNLSIAYYNHGEEISRVRSERYPFINEAHRCRPAAITKELAREEIGKACSLEPENSRLLLEQDQLLKRLDVPARERLALLEARREILDGRYALMLSYVTLLNACGQHREALDLLTHYTFHVWEGGEGKVADQYKAALFALAEQELEKNTEESLKQAYAYAERTLDYPDNLGEGKLDNVPDNRAYYLMGLACRGQGMEEEAKRCFTLASAGPQVPEPVRYYNDQPSDYIYYQGLAFYALGDAEKARKSFHQLIIFGEQHIFDEVGYDFFAVSLPELEVYQDDIKKRSDEYCRAMAALGRKGLEQIGG